MRLDVGIRTGPITDTELVFSPKANRKRLSLSSFQNDVAYTQEHNTDAIFRVVRQ